MQVYIAGKISGLDYAETYRKFEDAEKKVPGATTVINPCKIVPEHADWDTAMDICKSALRKCDAIYLLKDWKESKGAKIEKEIAEEMCIPLLFEVA